MNERKNIAKSILVKRKKRVNERKNIARSRMVKRKNNG